MTDARRRLLSWVRDGLAGQIAGADPGAGAAPARATLATQVTLATDRPADAVVVDGPRLALHGPGDVTGLDPRQILRTDPVAGATAFETDHIALVEFDDPALPWRLTPLAGEAGRGLRPWLVLVVVDTAAPGVVLRSDPRTALAILDCPIGELPDLARSAGWAHAEVATAGDELLADVLAQRPERAVSRLLAPRRLAPERRYLACVVPAFEHGRLAGLGRPVPADGQTAPAWPGESSLVTLPVYHSWSFATGPSGDFATLAQRLRATPLDPGWLELSLKAADDELTEALGDDPGLTRLLPALTEPGLEVPGDVPAAFSAALEAILGRGADTVTPPLYLSSHIGRGGLWGPGEPPWMRELNLDPRWRAAAGLGAEVVRVHQEALMSAAWRQAAALEQVNRELQRGRLGRAVSASLHRRHFTAPGAAAAKARATGSGAAASAAAARAASDGADLLVQRAAVALHRIAGAAEPGAPAAPPTLGAQVATHEPTASTASADVQRAARPTGPAARTGGAGTDAPLPSAVTDIATNRLVPAPPVPAAADAGVLDRYTGDGTKYGDIDADLVGGADEWWRTESVISQPLVSPGPFGYLTDLVVIQEATPPAPAWPAPPPPPATVAVRRGVDFDGRVGPGAAPVALPGDPAKPTPRLAGGLVTRALDGQPRVLLAALERISWYDEWSQVWHYQWDAFVRWLGFGADGTPQPGSYLLLEHAEGAPRAADIALRRRAGQPDSAAELVLAWAASSAVFVRRYALDTRQPDGGSRRLPMFVYEPVDIAIDLVPVAPAAGAPAEEPRDLVVAAAIATTQWRESGPFSPPYSASVWVVQWWVGQRFASGQEAWSAARSVTMADRVAGDQTSATLSLTITDLDGDGAPDLVVSLGFDAPQAGGGSRRLTRQRIGHGLDAPSGPQWDAGHDLDVPPLAGAATTVCVFGDVAAGRAARVRDLGDNFKAAAARHQHLLINDATAGTRARPAGYDVADVAAGVTAALDPATTIPAAVSDRVSLGGAALTDAPSSKLVRGAGAADPLRDRLYEPSFPQAMSEPLRELLPELVFPGADSLPDDGVALLGGNSELIAAYLAGANHELGRELLWRGFPSSGRATWFRSFFDARSADPAVASGDIRDIADWGDSGGLADKTTGAASDRSVILLVRGELLRRYPNAVVLAARAVVVGGRREPAADVLTPAFSGRAGAGVSLFSFAIAADEVATDPGWFFIFAEPPTEPRFAASTDPDWAQPGARAAAALLRAPVRVAFHASDLVLGP